MASVEAKSVDEWGIFKTFTGCPNDPKTLILDLRPHKNFKKLHILGAYCVRLSSNGKVLADYSQSSYSLPWSQHCWWGKPVLVYGPASLGRDHPVIQFLLTEGRCASVQYYKPGFEAFEGKMPYLCTPSLKASSIKKYPSVVLPGFLFLGDWADAQNHERLKEISIRRVVTVHNHPDNMKVPLGVRHLKIELPDVEGADISPHFNTVYEFIADAERLKQPVLVHCGAGVSRSACLVMMYLMRSRMWSAQQCRAHCLAARSLVCPNDGFWRVLCALEGPVGILNKSDPNDTMGFAGADAPDVKLDQQAAGQPVAVRMITAKELKQQQEAEAAEAEAAAAAAAAATAKAAAVEAAAEAATSGGGGGSGDDGRRQPLRRGRAQDRDRSSSSRSSGSSSSSSEENSSTSSSSGDDSSRSRSRDGAKQRHRSRSRDRARGAAASGRPGHGSSGRRRSSSSRSRSRGGNSHKRHGSSRSRSRSRSRSNGRRRASRGRSSSRDQKRGRWAPSEPSAAAASAPPAPAAAAPPAPAAAAAGTRSGQWLLTLEVSKPEGLVGHLVLGPLTVHQRVVFGRAPSCNVVLEHLSVSRQHAQLSVDLAGTVNIVDMGAAHGTKLNDAWIKKEQLRTLPVGGTLQFGASTRKYKLLSVKKV